eukprot:TRINITY_DN13649_c0_g1_i1.p1 TRINITY_DN13649_c0_g1~~TRINITY_DN13649_c0_g1_i1.p1  ORF type:complete len:147 (+),score=26.81 TRINITY_DN13649_c0_g1_i1:263-703(+)
MEMLMQLIQKTSSLRRAKRTSKKRDIARKDIEGMLSSLVYNKYKMTNIHTIAPFIFSDDTQISKKIHSCERPMPPPAYIAEGVTGSENKAEEKKEPESEVSNERMRSLIKDLQLKSFADKKQIFHVFREYDRDCDGYVSYLSLIHI